MKKHSDCHCSGSARLHKPRTSRPARQAAPCARHATAPTPERERHDSNLGAARRLLEAQLKAFKEVAQAASATSPRHHDGIAAQLSPTTSQRGGVLRCAARGGRRRKSAQLPNVARRM